MGSGVIQRDVTRPGAMRRVTLPGARRVVGAGVAALVIAACSSGSKPAAIGAATSTAPAAAATPTTVPSTTAAVSASSGATTTAAGTSTTRASGATPATGPAGDAFYTAPSPLPGSKPGDLIWSRTIPWDADADAYLILYRSATADGTPIAVSGTAVVPKGQSPAESRPILTWAHGTTGLADRCATSHQFADGSAAEAALATAMVQRGIAFVATDYQGLGTPGDHAYVMNVAEGQNVLDAARAVNQLPATQTSGASKVMIWGHSQGGGAAAMAAELAPTYAPELNVVGAMAGAPAGDLTGIASATQSGGTPIGYALMAAVGVMAEYPSAGIDKLLTPNGLALADKIRGQCVDEILPELKPLAMTDIATPAIATDAALAEVLKANSAGFRSTPVPIFLYHGDADDTIPVQVSKTMLDRYCAVGDTVERKVYPGKGHVDVIAAALGDITAWLTARLDGTPATSSCAG